MEVSKACPVCGVRISTPLVHKALVDDPTTSHSLEDATVFGYRCQNGHIFLAKEDAGKRHTHETAA